MRKQDKSKDLIACEEQIDDCLQRSYSVLERLHRLAVMQEVEMSRLLHTPRDMERAQALRQAIETLLSFA